MPTPPAPRVMLITTDYPPGVGGLQTYSYRIARDLPGGLLAHVLIGGGHTRAEMPFPRAGQIQYTCHRGRTRWRALAWSLARILEFHARGKADFQLHMQWSTALPSLLLKKCGAGNHYLILIHGAELLDPGRPFLNRIKAAILAQADAVVSGSQHTADLFASLGLRSRRLAVIPYGNPLEGEPCLSAAAVREGSGSPSFGYFATRLLCMHRLVARKGTALLLSALAGLQHLPWALDLVGEGEEEASLRSQAARLGLTDRITFRPPVDTAEKIRLLSQASLFILPSLPPTGNNHVEGLGLTLLEAQSLGLPVLAGRTGGIPEAVSDGKTGLLFEAGDGQDLREKLSRLLQSAELRSRLGKAGPAWVKERFNWGKSLERLAGLIWEIVEKPRR